MRCNDYFHKYIRGLEQATGKNLRKKKYYYTKKGYHRVKEDYKEKGGRIHALRKEGKTLQEIGDIFGISRERARQIYNLYKIRNPHLHLPVKREFKEVICDECGRKTKRANNRATFYKKILCANCQAEKTYRRKLPISKKTSFRMHERSKYCLGDCKKLFTPELPYYVLNRCKKCFYKDNMAKYNGDRRRAVWLSYFYRGEEYPYKRPTF